MSAKVYEYKIDGKEYSQYWFNCPGCGNSHGFTVGKGTEANKGWQWNGSLDRPTFTPSLLCNKDYPDSRCHSFVTDGRIQFLAGCHHKLAGQTVDIPDWDDA